MGTRTSGTSAGCTLPAVIIATILSAVASAAEPNIPPDPNASVRKEKTPAQTITAPALKPVQSPRRSSASFTRNMPFGEAVDILRGATTPPVNIVVLWRDLENAGVYRDTPIGIDGVPGLTVEQCIDLLMASLSAGASARLGHVVRNGTVVVATTGSLPPPQMTARVYDIRDLVAEPARYFFPPFGFGGMMGPTGGYGGYGSGAPYLPGSRAGANNMRNLSGFVGSAYGGPTGRLGPYRGR